MYCKNCGKEIDDKATACAYCGVSTKQEQKIYYVSTEKTNAIAIVGFVLSFFVAIAGLICCILAYKRAPEYGDKGLELSIAGITVSSAFMVIGLIFIILVSAGVSIIS